MLVHQAAQNIWICSASLGAGEPTLIVSSAWGELRAVVTEAQIERPPSRCITRTCELTRGALVGHERDRDITTACSRRLRGSVHVARELRDRRQLVRDDRRACRRAEGVHRSPVLSGGLDRLSDVAPLDRGEQRARSVRQPLSDPRVRLRLGRGELLDPMDHVARSHGHAGPDDHRSQARRPFEGARVDVLSSALEAHESTEHRCCDVGAAPFGRHGAMTGQRERQQLPRSIFDSVDIDAVRRGDRRDRPCRARRR
nr:hypothetical protein [Sandaracinus amylolyticus]